MFTALTKAFGQLSDPKLRRVIRLGVMGAVACYVALVALVWTALTQISFFEQGWAETGSDIAIGLTAMVLPVLFFPALVTTIMGTMLEDVADAVEARHYPQLNWPRPQKWSEILLTTLRFLAVMVAVNLLALPVYVVLLVTGLTLRHHLGRLWLAGAVIALLFSVPLLNLLAPVIGTAFMVHLFQSLRRQTVSV